jgi:transcriptional regulator with XRE-family HTH domain
MAQIHARTRTPEVLEELGRRLRRTRLAQNLTVEEVAERSGVSPRTILRIEGGEGSRLDMLVRLLRGLGKLSALDAFLPEPAVSPSDLVRRSGKPRRRASPSDG